MQYTAHIRLPLFESADKPTWLYDWNETMDKLDDIIYNMNHSDIPAEIAELITRIEALETTVAEHGTDISTLQTQVTDILADINNISSIIPSNASPSNKLATMADVGSGGGGGHVIQNAAGQNLTQRDTMQFTDGLTATDDPSGQKTVISDLYEEIPYSTWSGYTEQEKAQHPNAIITGAPDVEGGSSQVYSTNEVECGEWIEPINGVLKKKKTYRRTIIIENPNNTWQYPIDLTSILGDVERIWCIGKHWIKSNNVLCDSDTYNTQWDFINCVIAYDPSTSKWNFYCRSDLAISKIYCIEEYTKTTDQWVDA